jgi:hypothetical protein
VTRWATPPAPSPRRHPPGPWRPRAGHTCRRPHRGTQPRGRRVAHKTSDAMDYTASSPGGKAGLSRRHGGLRGSFEDRIYREAVRAGLIAHREYAPAVMRGLTDEQRKALDAAFVAALHCEAGGAAPPRDAVRVGDKDRAMRPDLLRRPSREQPAARRGARACLSR